MTKYFLLILAAIGFFIGFSVLKESTTAFHDITALIAIGFSGVFVGMSYFMKGVDWSAKV